MQQGPAVSWLRRRVRTQCILTGTGAVLTLLAGVILLAFNWGLVYLVCWFCISTWFDCPPWVYSVVGLAVIPLLFWGNARTSRKYLTSYSFTTGTTSNKVVSFDVPGLGRASNVNPIAPDVIHNHVKMITDFLYGAPRVVIASAGLFSKTRRLMRFDVEGCAAVLAVLHSAGSAMTFQEIVAAIEGLNPVKVFPQLRDVEGVLFLQREPAGLSLGSELKEEMNRAT